MNKSMVRLNQVFAVLGVVMILIALVFVYLQSKGLTFGVNVSESLPHKVFLVKKNEPFSSGDIVQFNHTEGRNGFFPGSTRMMKIIAGMPGDTVEFIGNEFFINGSKLGTTKDLSLSGRELVKNSSKVLGEDEYFVFTNHPDSFDSRYIHMGYISSSQITGKVVKSW